MGIRLRADYHLLCRAGIREHMKPLVLTSILVTLMTPPSHAADFVPLSLDGKWQFLADSGKVGREKKWYAEDCDRTKWEAVETPAFWESYPGMATYDGWGWFARTFRVTGVKTPMSVFFSGVDDEAIVWLNGKEVGDHTGYTDPFAVDVSGALRDGENLLVVLVKDNGGGGGIYKPITLTATKDLDKLLRGPFSTRPARKSAAWVRDATIYSVYLRSFSPEGTFAGLEKRLPELKELGATVLWLLPIHPVGAKNRKGTLGSPYAVKDYYGINPEFGTLQDFKHLVKAVHARGLKLIIDLVANHTSWDSELIHEHPEWFTHDSTGKIIPPNADWTDVADLDYDHRGLRDYMIEMMCWWVGEVGIDGFRCDVAEMVPTDFWEEARGKLDRIKQVMMLAEGSLPAQHVKAFDLTYSWNVYEALAPLLQGKRPVALLDQILKTEELQFPRGSLRMRFTTNHDKNAWDAPAVLKFGEDGLKLGMVLVNTLPGVPMIYTGEEVANDKKLSLFEKVGVDWNRSQVMGLLWKKLFALRKSHPALRRGDMARMVSSEPVFAFTRRFEKDRLLVVLNFGSTPVKTELNVGAGKWRDAFTGKELEVKKGRAVIELPKKGYAVFVQ
jgi:glycosidase